MANRARQIYLATGNAHKVREFRQLAAATGTEIEFTQPQFMPVVVEDTGTFIGNARKKAAALKAILPAEAWVLADDSGLCVDALGGAPGVESAYYARPSGDSAANLAKLIKVMDGIPSAARRAHFTCVLVLHAGANEHVCEAHCAGRLKSDASGAGGFGYDPLFVPDGFTNSFAELAEEVKNKISHRGRAWLILSQRIGRA